MKKRRRKTRGSSLRNLPVDMSFVSPLFSFGRVRGLARLFLTVEMLLATLVVLGTLLLVVLASF